MTFSKLDPIFLRQEIDGVDLSFKTPFGHRIGLYCEYLTSGRRLKFIENYIRELEFLHGCSGGIGIKAEVKIADLLNEAENIIKKSLNAGNSGKVIISSPDRLAIMNELYKLLYQNNLPYASSNCFNALGNKDFKTPVIFTESDSEFFNDCKWCNNTATLVKLNIYDQLDLESQLKNFEHNPKIALLSAFSIQKVQNELFRLFNNYKVFICVNYINIGPYVEIDLNPNYLENALDAVLIFPNQFLGGNHNHPLIVVNGKSKFLPDKAKHSVSFSSEIEIEELTRSALVLDLKKQLGLDKIQSRLAAFKKRFLDKLKKNPNLDFNLAECLKTQSATISFNIYDHNSDLLQGGFVTRLLSDLFGIQIRLIREKTFLNSKKTNIKPGKNNSYNCELDLHFIMDNQELDYLIAAIDFIGYYGHLFLALYNFDLSHGVWKHKKYNQRSCEFSLALALESGEFSPQVMNEVTRYNSYSYYLNEAKTIMNELVKK